MSTDEAMSSLPVCQKSGKDNISHVIFIHGQLAFTPTEIEAADWQILLQKLAV
jgi:hypothetical protein